MTKKKFNVQNNIDSLINMEIGKRMAMNGERVRKYDIVLELAEFANVSKDNINAIRQGNVTPSLPVAMKITEYFNLKVEDVFKIS